MTPRAGWERWLAELRERGSLHGSVLVDYMCAAAMGRYFTSPSDADDALNWAEREGVIARAYWAPTHSQRAMLGLTFRRKPDEQTRRFYASHWEWQTPRVP